MSGEKATGYMIWAGDTEEKKTNTTQAPLSPSFTLLGQWLTWMTLCGRSTQAVRDMRTRVAHALRYFESLGLDELTVGREDVRGYQGSLIERGVTERTVASYMGALRSYFSFLEAQGARYDNPARGIKSPQAEHRVPWGLPDEKAMESFLTALSEFHTQATLHARKFAFRTHVIAELQYASGLRIEEVSQLEPSDLDLERGTVLVRRGKGGRARVAFLTGYAKELLRLWLDSRLLVLDGKHDKRRLFGATSSTLTHAYNRDLDEKARAVGLSGWRSHRFRHALGYHLLRSGCDLRRIKEILGHRRIRTTEIYTEVNREDLRALIDAHHPRSR